jgi:hypothetical protein
MVACGGKADADFANAFGRESYEFLADEYIANLITATRNSNLDSLFYRQPKLTDGASLHHYVLLEALRKLDGGADDPQCMSKIKSWAMDVLSGDSDMSKNVRERLSKSDDLKRLVVDFSRAVRELKPRLDEVESRFAKMINNKHTKITEAMLNISNPTEKLGKVAPADAANNLMGKMAFTINQAVNATFDAISRQEEFDAMVDVQKRFAKNEATDKAQNERLNRLDTDVAAMKAQLAEFSKTANDVKTLQSKTGKMEAALSKALDVMLSLAIRSGEPALVAATKTAGAEMGYVPKEVRSVKPQITEVQHFFGAPALANSSDTCTGATIKRGAGVMYYTATGPRDQCWVNFRYINERQWASTASTIWFRVFGAAEKITFKSRMCDGYWGRNTACKGEFTFNWDSETSVSTTAGSSGKLTGSPSEGVFDLKIPGALQPFMNMSNYYKNDWYGWDGEYVEFTPSGTGLVGQTTTYQIRLYSPIVLDYTNVGRPLLSSLSESNVRFDLDGNGSKERTGWIAGYGGVGLLALDLNENGKVDDGLELFGEGTKLNHSGKRARDGYSALAQYDLNRDGVIDSKDAVYRKLVVWFDKNKDGQTSEGELVSLESTGVTKVALKHKALKDAGRFVNGNELRTTAKFWGPQECGSQGCNSYDVYFSTAFTTVLKGK